VLDAARFAQVQSADLVRFPERQFLCRWELTEELHRWSGPTDIRRWLDHIQGTRPELDHCAWTLPADREALTRFAAFNGAVLGKLFGNDAPPHDRLDFYDMTDWVFIAGYPRPVDRLERVLDFGAGFSRQAALWLTLDPSPTYVAVDSIELPYLAQHAFLAATGHPLVEYMEEPGPFAVRADRQAYHLPGWRHDLLLDGFFDLVVCVQVLPELREDVLMHSIRTFRRVLRPGGRLYVRDHPDWKPGNKQDIDARLTGLGFVAEFTPVLRDRLDCHGVPRVYRLARRPTRSLHDLALEPMRGARRVVRRLRYEH
jgi:SAM-dependent methyltransferase